MSEAFAADPYISYRLLREKDAPYYWPQLDIVMLSRYSDISEIALNEKMVRSLVGYKDPSVIAEQKRKDNFHDMPYHERFVQKNLLDSDGPHHNRLRKLVFGAFTGTAVKSLENAIQGYVDSLLDSLPNSYNVDFIDSCATHLPGLVIGHFLGITEEDARQLRLWSEQVVAYFDVDRTAQKKQIAETAVKAFHDYLVDLKAQRLRTPKNDLISKMIEQETKGLYGPDEVISTCMLILMAGHGSTIDVLGTGLYTLLKNPDSLQALRHDLSAIPTAIQEMFRYEPPLPFFHRHATQDVSLRGHNYPAGTTFGLLYASANRDADIFETPDHFNIRRHPNRHLAFGQGAHLCLGNHLARLNMKIMFTTLLARFDTLELATDHVDFKPGLSVRGLKALPIKLS